MYFNGHFTPKYYTDNYWRTEESVVPVPQVDPGGYVGFVESLREEEELMLIIQSFLHMRN